MSDDSPANIRASHAALRGAGVSAWTWNPETTVVSVHTPGRSGSVALDGEWQLEAFLQMLDGLEQSRFCALFKGAQPGGHIDTSVAMASGKLVRMIGTFENDNSASGLLIAVGGATQLLGKNDLSAVFQPIISVTTRNIVGVESLARFRQADGQLMDPETAIVRGARPDWAAIAPTMLEQSASLLNELYLEGCHPFVQVNLSAIEIGRPDLVDSVIQCLDDLNVPTEAFRIEVTEQAALRDMEHTKGALARIKEAGAGIVLDDFSAGHSSLMWLDQLPVDGVKLDAGLTRLMNSPRSHRMIQGIISILLDLGLTVTAEGVEDLSTLDQLAEMGCQQAQGFAIAQPMGRAAAKSAIIADTKP